MPPKKRITREDIITAALQLVRSESAVALNARNVAKALGCSTQPVFYEFNTMDQLKEEVLQQAGLFYLEFLEPLIRMDDYLYSFGIAFIEFVQKERNLYQLIFMSGELNDFNFLEICDENLVHVNNIEKLYNLSHRNAEKVFIQLNLYAQGIASVLYSNSETFRTDGEIRQYLREACTGFLKAYEEVHE